MIQPGTVSMINRGVVTSLNLNLELVKSFRSYFLWTLLFVLSLKGEEVHGSVMVGRVPKSLDTGSTTYSFFHTNFSPFLFFSTTLSL